MMKIASLLTLSASFLFSGAPLLTAETVLSNLGNASSGSVIPVGIDFGATSVAQSFIVGPTTGGLWSLQSVSLGIVDGAPGTEAFSVSIYSDNGDFPGTKIATLTGETNPIEGGIFTYSVTGEVLLTAGNLYWIAASVPTQVGGYGFNLDTTADASFGVQASGWGLQLAFPLAITTDDFNNGSVWATDDWGGGLVFSIEATAVPEPSAYVLLAGGLFLSALLQRIGRGSVPAISS